MGSVTATYTALSDSAYYTMTGRGVPLSTVLEDAGVYKDTEAGKEAFRRFIRAVNQEV